MRSGAREPLPSWLTAAGADELDLRLEVVPHSRRARVVGGGARLAVQLAVALSDPWGNQALAAFVAERLGIERARVTVLVGHASWRKAVRVVGVTPLRALLALAPPRR